MKTVSLRCGSWLWAVPEAYTVISTLANHIGTDAVIERTDSPHLLLKVDFMGRVEDDELEVIYGILRELVIFSLDPIELVQAIDGVNATEVFQATTNTRFLSLIGYVKPGLEGEAKAIEQQRRKNPTRLPAELEYLAIDEQGVLRFSYQPIRLNSNDNIAGALAYYLDDYSRLYIIEAPSDFIPYHRGSGGPRTKCFLYIFHRNEPPSKVELDR